MGSASSSLVSPTVAKMGSNCSLSGDALTIAGGGVALLGQPMSSGVWNFEVVLESFPSTHSVVGLRDADTDVSQNGYHDTAPTAVVLGGNGKHLWNGTWTSGNPDWAQGCRLRFIFDADTQKLQWYLNGTLQPALASLSPSTQRHFFVGCASGHTLRAKLVSLTSSLVSLTKSVVAKEAPTVAKTDGGGAIANLAGSMNLAEAKEGAEKKTNRPTHSLNGEEDSYDVEYKPIATYIDSPPAAWAGVLKPCSACVLDDCAKALPEVEFLPECVREVSLMTASKLANPAVKLVLEARSVTASMLFAIILFTFDLCLISAEEIPREKNFYFGLNTVLRKRNGALLAHTHGFLYYMMTGLSRLEPYKGEYVFRGIDKDGAARAEEKYSQGRLLHFSAFSSAVPEECVSKAKEFAEQKGPGGLLIRIRLLKANSSIRDIRRFSAFPDENEVLLLPNFRSMVISDRTYNTGLGIDVIDLCERANQHVDVF